MRSERVRLAMVHRGLGADSRPLALIMLTGIAIGAGDTHPVMTLSS